MYLYQRVLNSYLTNTYLYLRSGLAKPCHGEGTGVRGTRRNYLMDKMRQNVDVANS